MKQKMKVNYLMACLLLTLGMGNSLGTTQNAMPKPENIVINAQPKADNEAPIVDAPGVDEAKTMEQSMYESNLRISVVKYGLLKNNWPLKFPRQALKNKKIFSVTESKILTQSIQTLLSLDAPLNESDLPEMYALWVDNANLMDESESAGLYTAPPDLLDVLNAWRMKKKIDKAMLDAPWIMGPSNVEIDPNVTPILIPAGFKFLSKQNLTLLQSQLYEIKRAAITQNKVKFSLPSPTESISALIAPIDVNRYQQWTASVTVINGRFVDFDGEFQNGRTPNNAALIETVKNRLNPTANLRLKPGDLGSYNKNLVRWLIAPKSDAANQSIQYAITNGAATKALGIDYAFLKLGKNQQVIVTLNHLNVAESLSRSEYLPEGKKQSDYLAENVLNPVLESIGPILQSISFKSGFQLKDATDADKKSQVKLSSLIEGQPTVMEKWAARESAKQARKDNFLIYLKDHPRAQGVLLLVLGGFFGVTRKKNNKSEKINVYEQSSGLGSIYACVFGLSVILFFVWLNFLM